MTHDQFQETFYELSYYTRDHADPAFIHQHVVDVFAAQTSDFDSPEAQG